jgi:hypothetical protein
MVAAAESNCLYLPLVNLMASAANPTEAAVALVALRKDLERFGSISKVSELEGDNSVLKVAYVDEAAAAKAREAFAHATHFQWQLTQLSNKEAATKKQEKLDEAFMCRTAATLSSLNESSDDESGAESPSTPTTPDCAKPRSILTFELSQLNWQRLSKDQEWRTVLQLRGLPQKMGQPGVLEALLASKGLSELVEKVKVQQNKKTRFCSALLHARNSEGVAKLAKFFHGRQFQGSSIPVSASFATEQGLSFNGCVATVQETHVAKTEGGSKLPFTLQEPMMIRRPMMLPPGLEAVGLPPGLSAPLF